MEKSNQGEQDNETSFPLVARELSKTYPGAAEPALQNLTIEVERGEIFGLLGPNGAGKTTALSIMSSILRPDIGEVLVCGVNVFKKPRKAKQLFGFVPQDIALYSNLTARENLAYFGRLYGLGGKILRERINESLAISGLEKTADQRIKAYSGGMRRRANLAASLLHHPRLLLLDEPTVGIDAQSRNMILEKLSQLKEEGVGMIYTTHYMEEAESICTRLAIIDKGKIIARGAPHDLIGQQPGCRNLGELYLQLTGKQLRD